MGCGGSAANSYSTAQVVHVVGRDCSLQRAEPKDNDHLSSVDKKPSPELAKYVEPAARSDAQSNTMGHEPRTVPLSAEYGASHTSFYTEEVAKNKYDTLDEVLGKRISNRSLQGLLTELLAASVKIAEALRTNLVTVNGSSNTSGDKQLTVDVIADDLLWDLAKSSPHVHQAASEEKPDIILTNPEGQYILCWDPLDGSSIIDNNWSVGTIVGIWDKCTGLIGASGRDQVMSLVVLYGPRTTAFLTLDDGVYEFTLGPDGQWICSREQIQIKQDCKIFSPANLRAAQEIKGYADLINHYMQQRYTLRYTGGLVPDVCQQLIKKQGVFTNPTSSSSPAKLRLAFEAAPFGRIIEMAGGSTSDCLTGGSILDVQITAVDQRTALALGSSNEVSRFNVMVLNQSQAS